MKNFTNSPYLHRFAHGEIRRLEHFSTIYDWENLALLNRISRASRQLTIITGPTGTGKSLLAFQYAKMNRRYYTDMRFCDFFELATSENEFSPELVIAWAENSDVNKPFLLILDGVVDKADPIVILDSIITKRLNCQVILTSRVSNGWDKYDPNIIHLNNKGASKGADTLMDTMSIRKVDLSQSYVTDIQAFINTTPLLLDTIIRSITARPTDKRWHNILWLLYQPTANILCPYSYMARLKIELERLISFTDKFFPKQIINFHNAFTTLSFRNIDEHIDSLMREYQHLTNLMSLVGSHGLSDEHFHIKLFTVCLRNSILYIRKNNTTKANEYILFSEAVSKKLSMRPSTTSTMVNLMTLVKGVMFHYSNNLHAAKLIFKSIIDGIDNTNITSSTTSSTNSTSGTSAVDKTKNEEDFLGFSQSHIVAIAQSFFGSICTTFQEFTDAKLALEAAIALKESSLQVDKIELAMTYLSMGNYHYQLQEFDDALKFYKRAYENLISGYTRYYSFSHKDSCEQEYVGSTLYHWAVALRQHGDSNTASQKLDAAVKIFLHISSEQRNNMNIIRSNICSAKLKFDKYQLIEPEQMLKKILGEYSPYLREINNETISNISNISFNKDILDAIYYLGRIYVKQARYGLAHIYFRINLLGWQTIKSQLRTRTIDDSRSKRLTNYLVRDCQNLGITYTRILHQEHSKVLHQFAKCFYREGKYENAQFLLDEAVTIEAIAIGLGSINLVADNNYKDARVLFNQTPKIHALRIFRELANVLFRLGKAHNAIEIFRWLLPLQERIYATTYPDDLMKSRLCLARIHVSREDYADAKQVLSVPIASIGDIYMQDVHAAIVYYYEGDFTKSLNLLDTAVAAHKKLALRENVREDNPRLIPLKILKANICIDIGAYSEGLEEISAAKVIHDRFFNEPHHHSFSIHRTLGYIHLILNNLDKAESHFTRITSLEKLTRGVGNNDLLEKRRQSLHLAWLNLQYGYRELLSKQSNSKYPVNVDNVRGMLNKARSHVESCERMHQQCMNKNQITMIHETAILLLLRTLLYTCLSHFSVAPSRH